MSMAPASQQAAHVGSDGRKYYQQVPINNNNGIPKVYAPIQPVQGPGSIGRAGTIPVAGPGSIGRSPVGGTVLMAPQHAQPTVHHSRELVGLNVGGKFYMTLFETLARFRSPYFERIVTVHNTSGHILLYDENVIRDQAGSIFIDRNGELFQYVLQYMRDGKHAVFPDDVATLKRLKREADFFGLGGLQEVLEDNIRLNERRRDDRDEMIQSIKATVSSISQSLYVTNFSRR